MILLKRKVFPIGAFCWLLVACNCPNVGFLPPDVLDPLQAEIDSLLKGEVSQIAIARAVYQRTVDDITSEVVNHQITSFEANFELALAFGVMNTAIQHAISNTEESIDDDAGEAIDTYNQAIQSQLASDIAQVNASDCDDAATVIQNLQKKAANLEATNAASVNAKADAGVAAAANGGTSPSPNSSGNSAPASDINEGASNDTVAPATPAPSTSSTTNITEGPANNVIGTTTDGAAIPQ